LASEASRIANRISSRSDSGNFDAEFCADRIYASQKTD